MQTNLSEDKAKSRALSLELAEISHVIKVRKYLNPLEWFKSLKYQRLFEDCKAKVKGVFGGNRSGKTQIGAKYVIEFALKHTKSRIWVCAETEEISINIQQRKIWELLPKNDVKYCYYDEVNGFRNGKIVFKNGTIIRFKTYKQGREAFQSDDIDLIWNDEEPPYDIYREQRMRLIDRDGEMIFTMTALKGVTELVSEIYDDHDVIKSEHNELVGEDLPRIISKNGATFFMLWTTENPHISQERLLEDVKVMSKSEIKSRICGIPLNMAGRIYPMFNKQIHVVSDDMIPKRLVTLYHVLDPHDRKPWAMQWWAVHKSGTAYCIREYPWLKNFNEMEYDDKTYDDYVEVIRQIEDELLQIYGRTVYKRIIDPNFGNKTVQLVKRVDGKASTTPIKELRARGLKFVDGVDILEAGHLQVRKLIHWAEKDGEIIVQPQMLWSERCENSILHMSRYSWKDIGTKDGDEKAKPGITQIYKDFCDTGRYFAMSGFAYHERKARRPQELGRPY